MAYPITIHMTTQANIDLAKRLIEIHAACKRRKGGKAKWISIAAALIHKATGKHFHGAAYCDGFLLNALREIAAK